MSAQKPLVICLMGPTASGKTRLAIELCEKLPVDIISVDSTMVYKGLDIGSAKPTIEELKLAPHRLINIREYWQAYSASDFCTDATAEIERIIANKRIPLLVGGTMLYFKALQQGLNDMPTSDQTLRNELDEKLKLDGSKSLHQELEKVDPVAAKKIHSNDPQRIQRALEVYYLSGTPISELQQQDKKDSEFQFSNIGLIPKNREKLREVIALRFYNMLEQGLIEEVTGLLKNKNFTDDFPAARSVGYRQVINYLNNEIDFATMREKAITATRQLAKRQLTWLRSWPQLIPLDSETVCIDKLMAIIENQGV